MAAGACGLSDQVPFCLLPTYLGVWGPRPRLGSRRPAGLSPQWGRVSQRSRREAQGLLPESPFSPVTSALVPHPGARPSLLPVSAGGQPRGGEPAVLRADGEQGDGAGAADKALPLESSRTGNCRQGSIWGSRAGWRKGRWGPHLSPQVADCPSSSRGQGHGRGTRSCSSRGSGRGPTGAARPPGWAVTAAQVQGRSPRGRCGGSSRSLELRDEPPSHSAPEPGSRETRLRPTAAHRGQPGASRAGRLGAVGAPCHPG